MNRWSAVTSLILKNLPPKFFCNQTHFFSFYSKSVFFTQFFLQESFSIHELSFEVNNTGKAKNSTLNRRHIWTWTTEHFLLVINSQKIIQRKCQKSERKMLIFVSMKEIGHTNYEVECINLCLFFWLVNIFLTAQKIKVISFQVLRKKIDSCSRRRKSKLWFFSSLLIWEQKRFCRLFDLFFLFYYRYLLFHPLSHFFSNILQLNVFLFCFNFAVLLCAHIINLWAFKHVWKERKNGENLMKDWEKRENVVEKIKEEDISKIRAIKVMTYVFLSFPSKHCGYFPVSSRFFWLQTFAYCWKYAKDMSSTECTKEKLHKQPLLKFCRSIPIQNWSLIWATNALLYFW